VTTMRARTGCQACRERHVKCVKRPEGDKCERCFEYNRDCFNTSFHRFKDVKAVQHKRRDGQTSSQSLKHADGQVWVNVPKTIGFVHMDGRDDDQDAADREINDGPSGDGAQSKESGLMPDETAWQHKAGSHQVELPSFSELDIGWHAPQSSALVGTVDQQNVSPDTNPQAVQHHLSPIVPLSPARHLQRVSSHQSTSFTSPRSFGASPHSSMRPGILNASPGNHSSPAFSLSPTWPFRTSREANLFYHYIKHISPWIDVLDPAGYFGREIPRRAAFQPLIANAIYALSSLHQSLLEGRDDHESPHYVDESLQYLKQILEDPLGHADENLLAGVILLRSHEEMSDKDENVHLLGGKRLLNSIASYAADGGFRESASWISLRQHIYISLTTQSPLGLNLSNYEHSSVFIDQSDEAWANRAVFLFARVLNYVFGSEDEGPAGRHETPLFTELETEVEAWNMSKPWYFSALWNQSEQERKGPWPEVQTSNPAHAVGLQYYDLCKIVLSIYDPRLSRLGFGSLKLRKASETTVLKHMRVAVGLAVSNPDVTNAMFQASHILAVCGSYLHDTADQEAAIDFLQGMNRTMGWRTSSIIEDLKEQWAA
jgi:hypothetical protein